MRQFNFLQKSIFGLLTITPLLFPAQAQELRDRDIVIAIIDTGVDTTHPLIRDNLWVNPNEKNNSLDNDGNGYAGDLHGWNFVSNNNDLTDHHGHGTHVAGIIRSRTLSSRVKFMILKYYDPGQPGKNNLMNTVRAIRYATQMKVDIINYSGGGEERSSLEEKAIREAQQQGILFVAAAGNDGRNTDKVGYYPAGYKLKNILSVAALDESRHLISSSNYGRNSVDIAAPGKNIYSALPGGLYGLMTGTSQATAWVTGLAASMMLQDGTLRDPALLKKRLGRQGIHSPLLKISALQTELSSL